MIVVLILHIAIALASLLVTAQLALWPTPARLKFSRLLVGSTLLSGTVLVIASGARLASVCLAGLTFLAISLAGLLIGAWRLNADSN